MQALSKNLLLEANEGREGKDSNHFLVQLKRQEKICAKAQDGCFRKVELVGYGNPAHVAMCLERDLHQPQLTGRWEAEGEQSA